jgi:steroid 5-alpha reductase family enzyme
MVSKEAISLAVTMSSTTAVGMGISHAVSGGVSLYLAFALSIMMQCVVFVHASGVFGNIRTEKFFDLTGSITFLAITGFSVLYNGLENMTKRKYLLTSCVVTWAVRLGYFLFTRICHEGGTDSRFNEVRKNVYSFGKFWWIQGLWVFLTSFPVQLVLSIPDSHHPDNFPTNLDLLGIITWLFGFSFEAIADYQKRIWKESKINKNNFINTGLWKLSRHPNYFGEISLWIGVFLIACNEFKSFNQYLSIISPIFTALLLIFVSGIPLLETSADKKWGDNQAYKDYKEKTPVLIPFMY